MADKRTRWIIEATSNIPDINTQLEKLIQLQRTQNELTQQNTTSTALAIQRQREQIESLAAAQSKANQSSQAGSKQQSDMIGGLRKEYDLLSKTLSGIVNLAAGAWAVGQLKTYVMEVINAKSAQDGFVASMEKMLGSRLKAEELNAKLMDIASKSPFSITQIQDVTKQLQGMGVETNKLIPYINALGDIAAVVGTGKLPLIAKAMTDVQNKGILMGGEIRQFTENGIPLFDLLAKSMEKPREEVVKLANAHKISFAEVEKAILQSTQKGGLYYGQMTAQAEQLGGKIANLGDKYTMALAKVGDFFEKGIKKGITILGDLIDATMGSTSAIERSIKGIEAAASIYALYRVAVLSINAALKANQVETLAGLAAKEADAVATVSMTASTTGLRTAMTGLWTAMRANPIGAVITLVTALYTAYQIWDAASHEVVKSLGEEEIKLKSSQTLLNDSVKSVTSLAVGTTERKKAMEGLISRYPEYFSGLSAETTNNATLNGILAKVNLTYKERIDLARQAYLVSQAEEKRTELLKEEAELMDRIKKRSPELYAQVQGDSQKLMEMINKGGSAFLVDLDKKGGMLSNMWDNAMNGTILKSASTISKGLKDVDKEILEATTRRESLTKKEQEAAIDTETARWKAVAAQMKKGSKEYEAEKTEHEKRVRDLSGETVKFELNNIDKVGAAKKSSLELSLENDLKELKSLEKTHEVKMAILSTEEKLKIEQAKRQITNAADEQERILSIQREYANKRNQLVIDSAKENMEEAIKWFDKEVEANRAKSARLAVMRDSETKEVKAMYNDVAKLDAELVDIQIKNKEKQAEFNNETNAQMAKDNKKFWQDGERVYLESLVEGQTKQIEIWQAQKAQLEDRANILKDSVLRQEEYKNILVEIAILEGKIAKEQSDRADNLAKITAKQRAELVEWLSMATNAMNQLASLQYEESMAQIDRLVEKVNRVWESAAEASKASFDAQIQNTLTSVDQLEQIWGEYAQQQAEILGNKQAFAAYEDSIRKSVEETKKMTEESNKFMSLLAEGKWVGAIVQAGVSLINSFDSAKRAKFEMEQKMLEDEREAQMLRLQLLQEKQDATEAFYRAEYDKYKETVDAEIQLAKDKYAALTEQERQFYSDSQLRLLEDSDFRQKLVREGEVRQTESLETSKQNLIKSTNDKFDILLESARKNNATEEEMAAIKAKRDKEISDITNAFNKLISDKHAEYQNAIGDKSKETSLANIEIKAQEADSIDSIQDQLNDVLDGFSNGLILANEAMNKAIVAAANITARAQMAIKASVWEADKAAAIDELRRAEMAAARRTPVDKALIEQLRAAQGDIMGMSNPYLNVRDTTYTGNRPTVDSRNGISKAGTYQSAGHNSIQQVGGGNSESSSGGYNNTPRPGKFHGDTWVEGSSNGIDPITLQLHPGERILQSYLNQFLGRGVSNQELVHGYLQYANFQDRLPDLSIPNIPSLQIPEMVSSSRNNEMMLDIKKELRDLNDTFAKKSLINVNIDANNVSISEQWESHKANYYNTLFRK